tara:strand:- start:321 stop:644 length:324 start_codon:yes stop_codon:yes gene_type:complete
MLIAKIDGVGSEQVDDGIFPTAIIGFYDTTTGSKEAICTYILQPGSAYQTMEDVAADVALRLAGLNAEEPPPPAPVVEPTLDEDGLLNEAIIESVVGQEVATAFPQT